MGVTVHGLDEWITDLETLPERSRKAFRGVVSKGAFNIKADWRARWLAIESHPTHIPHLVRGIGYDTSEKADVYSAEIGVAATNRQAFLTEIIERGTLTSAPHPAAVPAMDAEAPRMEAAAAKVAEDLLAGKT